MYVIRGTQYTRTDINYEIVSFQVRLFEFSTGLEEINFNVSLRTDVYNGLFNDLFLQMY